MLDSNFLVIFLLPETEGLFQGGVIKVVEGVEGRYEALSENDAPEWPFRKEKHGKAIVSHPNLRVVPCRPSGVPWGTFLPNLEHAFF